MAIKKRVVKKRVAKKKVAKKKVVKKRVAKKRVIKKRVAKKKVASTRKVVKPTDNYIIKIVKGKKSYYFNGVAADSRIKYAAYYKSLECAKKVAQAVADKMGNSAQVSIDNVEYGKKK